jgi:hypothetical protein
MIGANLMSTRAESPPLFTLSSFRMRSGKDNTEHSRNSSRIPEEFQIRLRFPSRPAHPEVLAACGQMLRLPTFSAGRVPAFRAYLHRQCAD